MKAAFVILILLAVGAVLFFVTRPKGIASSDYETYAKLKAMPPIAKNFETPEGAVLCLEDAYRRKNIEAAIAAKDFKSEAKLMLKKTGFKEFMDDPKFAEDAIAKAADALIQSYRAHTVANWPDFEGLESFFTKREPYADDVVVVTEVCRFPDGGFSEQRILVAKTTNGWRVLNSVSE